MSRHQVRILIVDDHQLIREGIRTCLQSQVSKYSFVLDEAGDEKTALKKIQTYSYDLIFMDYSFPETTGAEIVKKILKDKPKSKILALSNYAEYNCIKQMIEAGVVGYMLKCVGPTELIQAIESILNGKKYFCNEITCKLINAIMHGEFVPTENSKKYDHWSSRTEDIKTKGLYLTKREKEVLNLMANQLSNEEIAQKLNINVRTIESHKQNMYSKLNVKNSSSLIKYAYELNLIQ